MHLGALVNSSQANNLVHILIKITKVLKLASKSNSSIFVELLCRPGFRSNLIRPQKKMTFYKKEFMKYLKK